jgi:hypothetical protein
VDGLFCIPAGQSTWAPDLLARQDGSSSGHQHCQWEQPASQWGPGYNKQPATVLRPGHTQCQRSQQLLGRNKTQHVLGLVAWAVLTPKYSHQACTSRGGTSVCNLLCQLLLMGFGVQQACSFQHLTYSAIALAMLHCGFLSLEFQNSDACVLAVPEVISTTWQAQMCLLMLHRCANGRCCQVRLHWLQLPL